jgi:hypothetical protein
MGEFKIWCGEEMRLGPGATFAGLARVLGNGACCYLSLKIVVKSTRAVMVSSPTLVNVTTGCVFWKASVVSLAAISNRLVDDCFGI